MSAEANFVDVKIMGREYRVACPPEEKEGLLAAVTLVDEKMREIALKTKNTVAERVAVMAALHIAHDHLSAQKNNQETVAQVALKRRIDHMKARLDNVLGAPQEVFL